MDYYVDSGEMEEITDSMVENEDIIAALSSSEPEESRYSYTQSPDRSIQFQAR